MTKARRSRRDRRGDCFSGIRLVAALSMPTIQRNLLLHILSQVSSPLAKLGMWTKTVTSTSTIGSRTWSSLAASTSIPAEAEQVLLGHPEVADVACVGVPNREMGEELKALVVLADSGRRVVESELLEYCRQHLSHHKCPRSVTLVEDLGRTAMGKIDKRKLRSPWWE